MMLMEKNQSFLKISWKLPRKWCSCQQVGLRHRTFAYFLSVSSFIHVIYSLNQQRVRWRMNNRNITPNFAWVDARRVKLDSTDAAIYDECNNICFIAMFDIFCEKSQIFLFIGITCYKLLHASYTSGPLAVSILCSQFPFLEMCFFPQRAVKIL